MKINHIELITYSDKYKDVLQSINNDNSNHFVKQIDERLVFGNHTDEFKLNSGYLVKIDDNIVGYVYFSAISNYRMYIEYLILSCYRKKGYGSLLLKESTDYILDNYNIKQICLDIDKSNLASMKTAISCGYMYDDSDLIDNSNSINFSFDNIYYIDKGKKH